MDLKERRGSFSDFKPGGRLTVGLSFLFFVVLALAAGGSLAQAEPPLNPNPPAAPVRLVFVHHSVGEDLLRPGMGNLRRALNNNNYYVKDTNYVWGPADHGETIGDHTDIGHWYNWFLGPRRNIFLAALYATNHLTPGLGPNTIPKPPGGNVIVLFKSCYPNGQVISGNPNDPPRISTPADPNPLWGRSSGESKYYTVSNIKGLYRDLLAYFATRPDKLFILLTTPPSYQGEVSLPAAARARAIHTWLVHHWLDEYPYDNVAVLDYFNVLTSNGGSPDTNDLGAATGNHHRLRQGQVQHVIGLKTNTSAYPQGTDSHPTAAGHRKATGEFVKLLNVAYHAWQGDGGRPLHMGRSTLP